MTNPQPYEAWSVLAEYTAGSWTDITSRVDTARMHLTITSGDTPESSADTGGVALPIRNHDQAFTPGNPLTSQALLPGMRVLIRETVLDQVFYRFTGRVDYPEAEAWTESNATAPRDQLIMVPLVDEAAWVAKQPVLVGTLAEHIKYHGGTSLVGYWPMNEGEGPDVSPAVGAPWTIRETKRYNSFANAPHAGAASITYGAAGIPLADDISAIEFEPSTTTTPAPSYVTSLMLTGTRPTQLTVQAGRVLTVACWTKPGELLAGAGVFTLIEVAQGDPVVGPYFYAGFNIDAAGRYHAAVSNLNWFGTVDGPPAVAGHGVPVALRVGFDPPVLELWVRGEVYTDTLTVNTSASWSFDDLNVAERYPGAVNHAQVYVGAASDWTHDDFVAQYEMGLYGMERQSTGERIRAVLRYAGVAPSELGRIDPGVSLMRVASLAGRNPMDVVADAVETEQGELYADGTGRFVFADRVRLYNI